MPGPLPKRVEIRQKKRRYAGAAILPAEARPIKRKPQLPKDRDWLPATRRWWAEVWASPMAGEYLRSDISGLIRLAMLIDLFYQEPKTGLAAEIRQSEKGFGLTPLDRRRLEWQVVQTEEAKDKRDWQRSARAMIVDPRKDLGD